MKQTFLMLVAIASVVAVGCSTKEESKPVTVTSYKDYKDGKYNFMVRYPDGWTVAAQPGSRALFYSSQEIVDGFSNMEPKGNRGARIDVMAMDGGDAERDKSIEDLKGLFNDPNVVKAPESTTLNGMPATKVSYTFDLDNTKFTADRYYVEHDSVVTYIETAVIGNYNDYASVFKQVLASFEPGKRASSAMTSDTTHRPGDTTKKAMRDSIVTEPPSAEMKTYSGAAFTMSYPANFDPTSRSATSVDFGGARGDSRVVVDALGDTKGVTLDKIAEENKSKYGGRAASAGTVAGQKAYVFAYGRGDVDARAYFFMANGKLYRITTSWFKPQQNLYAPAFEKMLASFKAK
jgi:hypothetical protein